jgi:hypothetical protein
MFAFTRCDFHDTRNAVARRLRLGRHDGHLLAGERVQQRTFSGIGPAENGNKSRFQSGEYS